MVPGQQHFECSRLCGSVSTEWCAQQWREVSALPANTWHPRWVSCGKCEIGAIHAGVAPDKRPPVISEMRVCLRCLRDERRIIHGCLCVSCYNRQREYRAGRNAKGNRPVKHPVLSDVRLATVRLADGSRSEVTVGGCASLLEAVLRALRDAGPGVGVSFCVS